jgi:asparagine synthase (glutamine-hydrolysing)
MCGIYGSTVFYDDNVVKAKLGRVGFRGPDQSNFERIESVVLGHNRLAIVDLDKRSDQPFSYKHLKIVFNGEIYNYLTIRSKLKLLGHTFFTESDTEVLAAAYLEYGEFCVDHFNGMFAFVIYDTKKQIFFGGRDRLGKKPFYYAHSGLNFEFASQPSQITIGKSVNLDEQAINEFFVWGYIPEPRSAWKEIKKLKAGYTFNYDLKTGAFCSRKYWDIDTLNNNIYDGGYLNAKDELECLLTNAVKIRMHADVRLGVFLSGGIDSSLIAAIASKNINHVKTFCIKFNEKGFDESSYAGNIANYLKTDHYTIECNPDDGISLIENFGEYYDEPFADFSAIPSLLLSKYTKQHVTVALSGDGGDECFYGYTRYKRISMVNHIYKYPHSIRKMMNSIMQLSPNYQHKLLGLGVAKTNIKTLYALMFGGLEYSWLTQPEKAIDVPFMNVWNSKSGTLLQKMSAFDIKTYLNGDINTKVDRAFMAFAVEARAPLMDYRIVEFAQHLPDEFKSYKGVQKRILKDILYKYVPSQFFQRPKAGFTLPLSNWLKNELKQYVLDEMSITALKDIPGINVEKTVAIIQQHMDGKWNRVSQIWKLLVFTQWLKNQKSNKLHSLQTV